MLNGYIAEIEIVVMKSQSVEYGHAIVHTIQYLHILSN